VSLPQPTEGQRIANQINATFILGGADFVNAHGADGKRDVVHADDRVTEFLELESAIRRLKANCGP